MKLRFQTFNQFVTEAPFISVDGLVCVGNPNEILNLAHWPGNSTPIHLKANTTVEMALKLLHLSNWREQLGDATTLSNNHFDTDGVLACWALMAPDVAPSYAELMVSAAVAGDYGFFTTPSGVKLDLMLTNLQDPGRSPLAYALENDPETRIQALYDWVLPRLPTLFGQIDRYVELWEPEFSAIEQDLLHIASGRVAIREHQPSVLSVIESDRWLNLIARWSRTQGGRLLSIVHQQSGALFELQYALRSFHDRVDRPRINRQNLSPVADQLNQRETALGGRWLFDDDRFIPRLHFVDGRGNLVPSQSDPVKVEEYLMDYFAQFGNTWTYYQESPWGRVLDSKLIPVVPWADKL